MAAKLTKRAIDLGIVTRNPEKMLSFYRDLLGLEQESTMDMPGGGTMHRLLVGDSVVKIVDASPQPKTDAAPGGIRGATGYRYWTITVANLNECVEACKQKGFEAVVGAKVVRPGVTIAIIADPDGNWVELLENS